MGFLPLQHTQTRLLLLLSNCTKYDHELTLHKIVNARNWAYMCVLFVHMCIMVRVEYTICAHGYQSVYLEGLIFIQMAMWQMAQGKLYYFSYGYKIYLVNEIMISTIGLVLSHFYFLNQPCKNGILKFNIMFRKTPLIYFQFTINRYFKS